MQTLKILVPLMLFFSQVLACADSPKPAGPASAAADARSTSTHVVTSTDKSSSPAESEEEEETQTNLKSDASSTASPSKTSTSTTTAVAKPKPSDTAKPAAKGDSKLIKKVERWRSEDAQDAFLSFALGEVKKNYVSDADAAQSSNEQFASLFRCPADSFIVGLRSFFDEEAKDRLYQPMCDFFEDGSGQMVKKLTETCEVKEANAPSADLDFSCVEGKFLSGLKTVYDKVSGDRKFSFECCAAQHSSAKKMAFVELAGQDGKKEKFEPDMSAREVRTFYADVDAFVSRFATIDINSNLNYIDFLCKGSDPAEKSAPPSIVYNVQSQFWNDTKDRVLSLRCGYFGIGK